MIEARGAKDAYLYCLCAMRDAGRVKQVYHSSAFDVADSEDEAHGRAMRIALATYPPHHGWADHFVMPVKIGGFDWVGRHQMDKIRPCKPSGEQG